MTACRPTAHVLLVACLCAAALFGTTSAPSVSQTYRQRGAYLVEVRDGHHTARLVQDYHQRPIVRISFDVSGRAEPEQLREELFAQLRREAPVR